jgi:hypothetical protein
MKVAMVMLAGTQVVAVTLLVLDVHVVPVVLHVVVVPPVPIVDVVELDVAAAPPVPPALLDWSSISPIRPVQDAALTAAAAAQTHVHACRIGIPLTPDRRSAGC